MNARFAQFVSLRENAHRLHRTTYRFSRRGGRFSRIPGRGRLKKAGARVRCGRARRRRTSTMDEKNPPAANPRPQEKEWMEPGKAAPPREAPPRKASFFKNPLAMGIFFLVVVVLVVGGVLFWLHARKYESTEDAAIDSTVQQVSARVGGRVLRVLVDDNQDVTVGTELVELDPADFKTVTDQAEAALAQARGQAAQALAQKSVYSAQVDQAQANLGVAQVNADNVRSQLDRFRSLRESNRGAVSQEQWDNAVAADKTSSAQLQAAQRAVAAAEAQVRYAESSETAAAAAVKAAEARLELARLNLSYTKVTAALDGRVARKQISVGNDIQAGTPLMAIVPREVYVTANFKETQLARMKPGQAVQVKVDAYPDLKLQGHVQSFQPGTGLAFSGLPAENATGNWVKVVQRVPVKIVIDQLPDDPLKRLGPGMSVEVKVSIAD